MDGQDYTTIYVKTLLVPFCKDTLDYTWLIEKPRAIAPKIKCIGSIL